MREGNHIRKKTGLTKLKTPKTDFLPKKPGFFQHNPSPPTNKKRTKNREFNDPSLCFFKQTFAVFTSRKQLL